jgi:DNA (cytosine-5)-methyltransferase 1
MSLFTPYASYIDCLDGFCGCGGSSQALMDEGIEVLYALNHDELSLSSHEANFPHATHVKCDISQTDPSRYKRTRWGWFSPSCVHHTKSRGKKIINRKLTTLWGEETALLEDPEADRSRATMQDVIRFASVHEYEYLFVENVWEVTYWEHFKAWERELKALDYDICYIYFNSMFSPRSIGMQPPQSRDRWYAVCWKRWMPAPDLDFRPEAFCQSCEQVVGAVQSWKNLARQRGTYGERGQYVYNCPRCAKRVVPFYTPAMSAIDWSLPMTRIGDREALRMRALKPKTLERIQMGLARYCQSPEAAVPMMLETCRTAGKGVIRPVTEAAPTQTTAQSIGLVAPFLVDLSRTNSAGHYTYALQRAMPTQTTQQDKALVVPSPDNSFLFTYYGRPLLHAMSDPVPTITTIDRHALVSHPAPVLAGPRVEDCYFRMLSAEEVKGIMGFRKDYIVKGNQRQ